jgi:hypothetical protein
MKPLPASNLTDEDCLALVFVTIHRNKSIAAMTIRHAMCLESDRRDAELFLRQMLSRVIVIFFEERLLPPLFGRYVYCRILEGGVHRPQIIRSLEWP